MQTEIRPKDSDRVGIELADYTLPSVSFDYLERMRLLCEENGVELILIKAPTNNWKYYWYDEWDVQIRAYAEQTGLAYYNFIEEEEAIGIDWSTDTYDAGAHLNVYGAEKLTDYFGAILREKHGISDQRTNAAEAAEWQALLDRYLAERNAVKQ